MAMDRLISVLAGLQRVREVLLKTTPSKEQVGRAREDIARCEGTITALLNFGYKEVKRG